MHLPGPERFAQPAEAEATASRISQLGVFSFNHCMPLVEHNGGLARKRIPRTQFGVRYVPKEWPHRGPTDVGIQFAPDLDRTKRLRPSRRISRPRHRTVIPVGHPLPPSPRFFPCDLSLSELSFSRSAPCWRSHFAATSPRHPLVRRMMGNVRAAKFSMTDRCNCWSKK